MKWRNECECSMSFWISEVYEPLIIQIFNEMFCPNPNTKMSLIIVMMGNSMFICSFFLLFLIKNVSMIVWVVCRLLSFCINNKPFPFVHLWLIERNSNIISVCLFFHILIIEFTAYRFSFVLTNDKHWNNNCFFLTINYDAFAQFHFIL